MADPRPGPALSFVPGRRTELHFALMLLLSVVVLGAALEGLLRIVTAPSLRTQVNWAEMVRAAGEAGRHGSMPRFRPGAEVGHMRFNQFGLRGPDVPVPAPKGRVRIAFLGDSKVMSANFPEPLSLPAQTLGHLAQRLPGCHFDYLSVSGPGYDVPFLAELWAEIAPQARPDMAVVLAGRPSSLLGGAGSAPTSAPVAEQDVMSRLLARSQLLRAVRRQLETFANRIEAKLAPALGPPELIRRHHAHFEPLVRALADLPVLALGYRSAGDPMRAPGPSQPHPLAEQTVIALQSLARQTGWRFADPIRPMQAVPDLFLDRVHFSERGLAVLAASIAAEIAPHVTADCRIAR